MEQQRSATRTARRRIVPANRSERARRCLAIAGAALVATALSAAAWSASAPETGRTGEEEGAGIAGVVEGNTAFATVLHRRLASEPGNLFHSPFSISTALAMTGAGARGETARQMSEVLRLDLSGDATHAAVGALLADLNGRTLAPRVHDDPVRGDKPFELAIANALWGQEGYPFEASFVELGRARYGAALLLLDFLGAPEESRRRINRWVEERTNDRIRDLIRAGDLTPDARLVLTNAIYFKSVWREPFQKEATRDQPFHTAAGEVAEVPTMRRTDSLEAMDAGDLDVVKLPYGGRAASMVLLVPKEKNGLAAIEARIDAAALTAWVRGCKPESIDLSLPRFKFSSRFVLNGVLQALGMTDAFEPLAADFKGISPTGDLFLGFVIHQAFVDVDEKGTEAAAATAVGMRAASAPPPPRVVKVDRPFLFLIRDEKTGSILFMGRVVDPQNMQSVGS